MTILVRGENALSLQHYGYITLCALRNSLRLSGWVFQPQYLLFQRGLSLESVHHLTETHIHTSIQEHTATNTQHMDSRQQVLQITSGTEALVFSGSQSDSPSNGPFHIPPAPASLISSNSTHLSRVETLCSYSASHKLGRHRGAEANSQCGDSWFGSPG